MIGKVTDQIVNRAKEENVTKICHLATKANKNDIFGDEISQHSLLQPRIYYNLVSLCDNPISLDTVKTLDPDIRATRGHYSLQYIPSGSPHRNPKFPYLIGQDLVRMRVLVSGAKHWSALCSRIPELAWLKRNSTLRDEMFAIAKMHPGCVLFFGIDYTKYCNKIMKKAEEQGIDIDNKPLVTYAYNQSVYEKYKDIKLSPIKTKQDYLDEIEEAKKES